MNQPSVDNGLLPRTLKVYSGNFLVGQLHEGNDIWAFEYADEWLQSPQSFDLSPALPRGKALHRDGSTLRPVQWFFDNLLPEELLRQSIAKEASIKDPDDAFALLEYLGAESAGSLTLLPPQSELPETFDFLPLSHDELSERIANIPRQSLSKGAPKKMSLAGAQHKLLVVLRRNALYEPVGATPSTWILKPDHPDPDMYPATVFNEYVTMRLARAARLSVPNVQIRYVPQPVYLIERFDRTVHSAEGEGPLIERRHIIDACQLLNKAKTFKHSGATLDALSEVINAVSAKTAARTALFRWLVFNLLIANDDCHLKNLSFFMEADSRASLAPHYDLLSTGAYHTRAFANEHSLWPNLPLAISLPRMSTFGEVRKEGVFEAAEQLGLSSAIASRILDEVRRGVDKELAHIQAAHSAKNGVFGQSEPRIHAQEARLLSVLASVTYADMKRQLGLTAD